MRFLLVTCALLALGACQKAGQFANDAAPTAEAGQGMGIDRTHKGKPAPDIPFDDPKGAPSHLTAFAGKPLLVNLWASWCAPCVKELPTLDKLAQSKSGTLQVVAVSQDNGPHTSVEAFLAEHKVGQFAAYQDSGMALSGALNAEVLPTSVLYDAKGNEVWRYVGDRDWTTADSARLLAEATPGGKT